MTCFNTISNIVCNNNENESEPCAKLCLGIKCSHCELVFKTRGELVMHTREVHSACSLEFCCTVCTKSFTNYNSFRSHCNRHVAKFMCIYCDKQFSERTKLVAHICAKHDPDIMYACQVCSKTYSSKSSLNEHTKLHVPQPKKHECSVCGNCLSSARKLVRHMEVHRQGHQFMCDVCGQRFQYEASLAHHISNIHALDRPHSCPVCEKRFPEESLLKRHYTIHLEVRPFKCSTCEKAFKTQASLNTHAQTHDQAKRFVCTACGKGFNKLSKLQEHNNSHTGNRPYQCKFCEYSFTNSANMIKHMRRKHPTDKHQTQRFTPNQLSVPVPEPDLPSDLNGLEGQVLIYDLESTSFEYFQSNGPTFPY